jgi:ABC-type lipoprotein export system ATPase subunit
MTALLETVNICRDFKQANLTVHALVDVNISIEPGTLTMLAGRSGRVKRLL